MRPNHECINKQGEESGFIHSVFGIWVHQHFQLQELVIMAGPEVTIASAASKVLFSKTCYDLVFKWEVDDTLVTTLKTKVNAAKAVLNDAEMKQIVDGAFVDKWIPKARYAILDAEDLLDSILTDINKEKYRLGDSPGTKAIIKEKVKYKGKDIVRAIHPYKNTREAEMTETIQNLQNIIADASPLNLARNDELTGFRADRISTSLLPPNIIGRSEDEKKILQLLNSREGNDDALRVIPIVGMGGVGKTTLASLVYDRYKTSDQSFQVKGWVCVSDKFQVTHVIKSLLESITKEDAKASDTLEFLQTELKKALQDKRFLLVLDDIWSDVESKWGTLQTIFSVGAAGSRIIVTTREQKVADVVTKNSDQSPYEWNGLSDDDGWSLFQSHAFKNGDSSAHPILEIIGKEIVGKCKGSPLAIQMLGSLLFKKKSNEREWYDVLKSKIWSSTSTILPSLWLSYYHLSLSGKQCFAYLAIFPKDYLFSMKKMVKLWVAEGFVEKPRETNSRSFDYEHLGRTYFDDLCSNFFIQKSISHPSKFVMHDLVHDLAEYVSKDLLVNLTDVNSESRRLPCTDFQTFLLSTRPVQKHSRLRTLLPGQYDSDYLLNNKVCNDLLSNFKFLRVLSLKRYYRISELPASIGDMKLLRYLNLSYTHIEYLPQWICRLYNLQILQLSDCRKLKRLPASLCDLVNLRKLNVERTELKVMPDGIGGLTSLRTLPKFVLGEGNSKQMKEFENLNNLHGRLRISGLNNVVDVEDVVTASFENKEYLEELILEWDSNPETDTHLEEIVLDAMKPHKSLKRLTMYSYGGKRLPNWIVGVAPSFRSTVFLKFIDCFNCEALPSIGAMPFLEYLSIGGLDSLESLGAEFYGDTGNPFPALQKLEIRHMEVLKKWCFPGGDSIGFSSLKQLDIKECPELTEIPGCFPSLTLLDIGHCGNLRRLPFVGNSLFLKDIAIDGLDCLETLGPDFYGDALENLTISDLKVLKKWCFPGGDSIGFSSLKQLYIAECPELTEIPYCFPRLIELQIFSCPNLVRLEMREKGSESSSTIDGHSLHFIRITNCHKLEEIPKSFVNLAKVTIEGCMSLVSVPVLEHVQYLLMRDVSALLPLEAAIQNCVPKQLSIDGPSCTVIVKLLSEKKTRYLHGFSSLKDDDDSRVKQPPNLSDLYTEGGIHRNSFTQVFNLNSLTHLQIISCDDGLLPFLSALESLQTLWLERCPLIQHFPASSGLLFKSLRSLRIIDCPTLESLPDGFHNITALRLLCIKECPDLVVPEDGFPAMINILEIRNCGKMDPVSKLKLSKLTSLAQLELEGFPKTITLDHCIPASIEDLTIIDFPRLKSISGVLPSLKVLQSVKFIDCPLLHQNKSWSTKLKGICTSGFPSTDQRQ